MAIKVLGLCGSTRKGSINERFLGYTLERLKEQGAEVSQFDFRAHPLPLFNQDDEQEQGYPESVRLLKQAMSEADAIVVASPEYNSSITPLLKNFIDWASRNNPDQGVKNEWLDKPVALISASGGRLGGIRGLIHLRQIMAEVQAIAIPNQAALGGALDAYAEDGSLKDERTAGIVEKIAKRLVMTAELYKQAL